jgi:hypothetical protein
LQQPSTSSGHESRPACDGIVLAGPPASGKRTTTFALTSLRRSYAPFPALTVARQPSIHAEQTTRQHLDELRAWAQIFHEFTVEGTSYAFDRERLSKLREQGRIPVACVDDADALQAFEHESSDWLQILLWCPREAAERRLTSGWPAREEHEAPGRPSMRRWDRSSKGLQRDTRRFTLTIRSDRLDAVQVAQIVHLAAMAVEAARPAVRSA